MERTRRADAPLETERNLKALGTIPRSLGDEMSHLRKQLHKRVMEGSPPAENQKWVTQAGRVGRLTGREGI